MHTDFEQALQTVQSLSPQDFEKLRRWMIEQDARTLKQPLSLDANESQERTAKYKQALQWIDEHRQQYLGQWVCLDGHILISHGNDAKAVYREAKAKHIKIPFIEQVREKETAPYWGGWE